MKNLLKKQLYMGRFVWTFLVSNIGAVRNNNFIYLNLSKSELHISFTHYLILIKFIKKSAFVILHLITPNEQDCNCGFDCLSVNIFKISSVMFVIVFKLFIYLFFNLSLNGHNLIFLQYFNYYYKQY